MRAQRSLASVLIVQSIKSFGQFIKQIASFRNELFLNFNRSRHAHIRKKCMPSSPLSGKTRQATSERFGQNFLFFAMVLLFAVAVDLAPCMPGG
jgi:hypothetical protein